MDKEVSLKSDLKTFNIDVDDIEMNPHFFEVLQEAIDKMREETLSKNLEVVLNGNLIEARNKTTNYKTILGCRVSYADLEKSVSFIVRPDEKPSYENLEQQCKKQKEVIDKIDKYINDYNVFEVFSFPLMKRWEEEQVKSSIDYEFKKSLIKDLKDILKEV